MDSEEHASYLTENSKTEFISIPENGNDRPNETDVKVESNKDEIINDFIEKIHRRHSLLNRNRKLLQKLIIFISRSSNKDYLAKLKYSDEADEWTLRKLLDNIAAVEDEYHDASSKNLLSLETLKEKIKLKKESLIERKALFTQTIEKAALSSVNSETGESFSAKDVKELLIREEAVSKTLEEYQLLSIEKRHNLNLALEKKKNLAEGPIDFAKYEMMCIETQNNKEIIQPISEEIKNIMKKASNIINISSHLGQKLYLAQREKTKASNTEKELDKQLNEMRDHLFEEKMKYTKMKRESKELQHKFILLQYPKLIEDYNGVQQKNEEACKELQRLKAIYIEEMNILNKNLNKIL